MEGRGRESGRGRRGEGEGEGGEGWRGRNGEGSDTMHVMMEGEREVCTPSAELL